MAWLLRCAACDCVRPAEALELRVQEEVEAPPLRRMRLKSLGRRSSKLPPTRKTKRLFATTPTASKRKAASGEAVPKVATLPLLLARSVCDVSSVGGDASACRAAVAALKGDSVSASRPCGWCQDCYRDCGCEAALLLQSGSFASAQAVELDAKLPPSRVSSTDSTSDEELSLIDPHCTSSGARSDESEMLCEASGLDEDAALEALCGKWLLARIEGDMEALMTDAGCSWVMRRIARATNYGVGICEHIILMSTELDELSIRFEAGPFGGFQLSLPIGKSAPQETVDESGHLILATARWDGSALSIEETSLVEGTRCQPTRRYLKGKDLVCEDTTAQGSIVKRYFVRK